MSDLCGPTTLLAPTCYKSRCALSCARARSHQKHRCAAPADYTYVEPLSVSVFLLDLYLVAPGEVCCWGVHLRRKTNLTCMLRAPQLHHQSIFTNDGSTWTKGCKVGTGYPELMSLPTTQLASRTALCTADTWSPAVDGMPPAVTEVEAKKFLVISSNPCMMALSHSACTARGKHGGRWARGCPNVLRHGRAAGGSGPRKMRIVLELRFMHTQYERNCR